MVLIQALLSRPVDANIEDIAPSEDDVAEVGCQGVASVFCCAFKNYVHMAVAFYHFASILNVVLQFY